MRTTSKPRAATTFARRATVAGACVTLALTLGACSKGSKSATCSGTTNTMLEKGLQEQIAGNTSDAQSCYEAVIAKDPQNKIALYDLGLIYDNAGETTKAETQYREALAIDPKYDPALYNLGRLTAQTGDTAGAVSLYLRTIASNPKDAKAHFNLGLLYRSQGKTSQGNAEVQTAVGLDPTLKTGAQAQGVPLSGK